MAPSLANETTALFALQKASAPTRDEAALPNRMELPANSLEEPEVGVRIV